MGTFHGVKNIDEIIGWNLARLRAKETLKLEPAARIITLVTGLDVATSTLWRWEKGKYPFRLTDLHLLARFYGVSVLGLLTPPDTVTHVSTDHGDIPFDQYISDFTIDPRGSFIRRAETMAERSQHGSRTIQAALQDVNDRLAEKGGPADVVVSITRMDSAFTTYKRAKEKAEQTGKQKDIDAYNDLREEFFDYWGDIDELLGSPGAIEYEHDPKKDGLEMADKKPVKHRKLTLPSLYESIEDVIKDKGMTESTTISELMDALDDEE